MQAVDTNVLVRLLVRDDPRQLDAAERLVARGAWVSHVVLVETLWVLDAVYARSAEQIAAAVERLLAHAELTLQDADVMAAALRQFRTKPTLGFSDCLVLEVARKSGHLPLGTFDRNLGKRGRRAAAHLMANAGLRGASLRVISWDITEAPLNATSSLQVAKQKARGGAACENAVREELDE